MRWQNLLIKVLFLGFLEMTQLKLVFHPCMQEDQRDSFSGAISLAHMLASLRPWFSDTFQH